MQTMSTADAAFLYAETPTTPMHVGTAGVFDGPPPAFDEVIAMLERKLPRSPAR
jgi:diacylglycerol O-acyltransferase